MMLKYLVVLLAVQQSLGQNLNCDFSQNVQPGTQYYVYSPNYPNSYNPGITCRWIGVCPNNAICRLQCLLQMPNTSNCVQDRLLISRSGTTDLTDANVYCGSGSFQLNSTANRITVGLLTSQNTPGGNFMCTLDTAPATSDGCACGHRRLNRIVGGVETGRNEFPSMAAVINLKEQRLTCGGTIISARHVLTAAHCLYGYRYPDLGLIVGEHNLDEASSVRQQLYVSRLLIHPNFNNNPYDDVGLMTTATQIIFNLAVGPVCLPFKYDGYAFNGEEVIVLGWGTTQFGGPASSTLQKVTLDVISNQQCSQQESGIVNSQMCTYTSGKDSCQLDSGGPLLYADERNNLYLVGVVSGGRSCASEFPALNTRVTSYLNWIIANTPGVSYCNK